MAVLPYEYNVHDIVYPQYTVASYRPIMTICNTYSMHYIFLLKCVVNPSCRYSVTQITINGKVDDGMCVQSDMHAMLKVTMMFTIKEHGPV